MEQFSFCPTLAIHVNNTEAASSRKYQSQRNSNEHRQCVMIVGNDSAAEGMLNEALGEWGYDVLAARNGWEALVLAGRRSVDGMLVDIDLPIMDGRAMLSELRWLGYQIPVMMMLGESDERIQRQLLMEGAQGCCLKPFHLPSLQHACTQVFKKGEVEEYATFYCPAGSNEK